MLWIIIKNDPEVFENFNSLHWSFLIFIKKKKA